MFKMGRWKFAVSGGLALLFGVGTILAESPLAVIAVAENARIGTTDAILGTNVYPGDALSTADHGTLRLRVGGAQLYLLASSTATLAQENGGAEARLTRGAAGFSATAADGVEIDTPVGVVSPAGDVRTFAQVTVADLQGAIITVYEGNLLLRRNGQEETLAGGKEYRVSLRDDSGGESNTAPDNSKSRKASPPIRAHRYPGWFIEVAAIGSAGIGSYMLWQIATESPYKPSQK